LEATVKAAAAAGATLVTPITLHLQKRVWTLPGAVATGACGHSAGGGGGTPSLISFSATSLAS